MKKITRNIEGSLTLEAAIVFPVFLAILLLLINVVNMALIYVSMDHAVSETVKQIAVQAYPLKYLKSSNSASNKFEELTDATGLIGNGSDQSLTADAKSEIVGMIGDRIKGAVTDAAVKALAKTIITARIKELYPLNNFEARDAEITVLNMYNPNAASEASGGSENSWSNKDIAVTVEYKIKPLVPFLPRREIVLSNTAVEKAWVDD